jgi:hypothetical protein
MCSLGRTALNLPHKSLAMKCTTLSQPAVLKGLCSNHNLARHKPRQAHLQIQTSPHEEQLITVTPRSVFYRSNAVILLMTREDAS